MLALSERYNLLNIPFCVPHSMEKKPTTRTTNATPKSATSKPNPTVKPVPKPEPKSEQTPDKKATTKGETKPKDPVVGSSVSTKPKTVRSDKGAKPVEVKPEPKSETKVETKTEPKPIPKARSPYRLNPEDEDRIHYWYGIAGSYTRTATVAGQYGINVSPATVTRIIKKGQADKTV